MNIDDILNPGHGERKQLDLQISLVDALIEDCKRRRLAEQQAHEAEARRRDAEFARIVRNTQI